LMDACEGRRHRHTAADRGPPDVWDLPRPPVSVSPEVVRKRWGIGEDPAYQGVTAVVRGML
jgi:hypothetical protein